MRIRYAAFLAAASALFVALALAPAAALAGTYVKPFTVVSGPGNQGEPALDGNVAVWVDDSSGAPVIRERELPASGDPVGPITTCSTSTSGSRHHPAVSNGFVVWWDGRAGDGDIFGYHLDLSLETPVYQWPSEQVEPSVSHDFVVWQDYRSGTWDIYGAIIDPLTGARTAEFPVCTAVGAQTHPVIARDATGTFVVWQDKRSGTWDIYGAAIVTDGAGHWSAVEFPVCTQAKSQTFPSTDGSTIVWQDYRNGGWDIYGAAITGAPPSVSVTPMGDPICAAYAAQTHPQVSGHLVVWQDDREAFLGYGADIWADDLASVTEFPIVVNAGDQVLPSLSSGTVLWEDTRNGNSDVYGGRVTPWTMVVHLGNGSGWTKTQNVTAYVDEVSNDNLPVTQMLFFNEGAAYFNWQPLGPSAALTLPAGDGPKRVGIRFATSDSKTSPLLWQTINLDTTPPVTKAPYPAAVTKGHRATLKYRVNDAAPKVTVTIKIKTLAGTTVKTLSLGKRATNKVLATSFVCNLAAKTYRFWVYATDPAGNVATSVGNNKLVVK